MTDRIPVADITFDVQSSGALSGHPTAIVRLLPGAARMSPQDVLARVEALAGGPVLITLTGNDPADYDLEHLILLGQSLGHTFACETRGHAAPEWLEFLDHLTVAPPPPSSGHAPDWKTLHHVIGAGLCGRPKLSIRIDVMDEADFEFAEMVHDLFPPIDFYVSPDAGTATGIMDCARWLIDAVVSRQLPDMRISLPLGALLWGSVRAAA